MKIESVTTDAGTYVIFESDGHGKACKGDKKTTGIQIREYFAEGYLLLKTFNFTIGKVGAKENAIKKAREYIKENYQ